MTRRFYASEEKALERMLLLRALVTEQDIHTTACPLLASQLNELEVVCLKLLTDVRRLSTIVATCNAD